MFFSVGWGVGDCTLGLHEQQRYGDDVASSCCYYCNDRVGGRHDGNGDGQIEYLTRVRTEIVTLTMAAVHSKVGGRNLDCEQRVLIMLLAATIKMLMMGVVAKTRCMFDCTLSNTEGSDDDVYGERVLVVLSVLAVAAMVART